MTAPDPHEQFAESFKAVTAAQRRLRGRETHRPGELSYAQYGLLFSLAAGGALAAGELALAADVSPATATQMLDGLERAGLVERVRSGQDKRIVFTSLTERGRKLVESRRALFEPRWRRALAEFSDQDLLTAAALLDRIREMFDELAERPEAVKLPPDVDQKLTPAA
jgi:MarR family transcriptional regulator, organic hydroperoxide resistance regulator